MTCKGKTAAVASHDALAMQLHSAAEWALMVSGYYIKAWEKGLGREKADNEL